jgi:retinoid hydroxylase
MVDVMSQNKSLPGNNGLPLLGETLRFLGGPYQFIEERTEQHGSVFRTHLLGKPCVVMTGPKAAEIFINEEFVQREGSQPGNIFALFAGPSVPHLDGEPHRERKKILMQAFTREALTSYVPALQTHLEESFLRWTKQSEIRWVDELQRFAIESVCGSFLGESKGARVDELRKHYKTIDKSFTGMPIKLPGTAYTKGLAAIKQVLGIFHELIAEHQQSAKDDGLERLLKVETPQGNKLSADQAAREIHHMIIAGRIVWAHLASLVIELKRNPELHKELSNEVLSVTPQGPITVEQLHKMTFLNLLVQEVKRVSPVVPGIFGMAKRDFEVEGHTIPKGWMLLLSLRASHQLAEVYKHPERFDPQRMAEGRSEQKQHAHGFFPHGPGQFLNSHHCAGTDYATILTQLFAIVLTRSYHYDLPTQTLDYTWNQLTPEPKDGLRAVITDRNTT